MSDERTGTPCRACGRWYFAVPDLTPSGYCQDCALTQLRRDLAGTRELVDVLDVPDA